MKKIVMILMSALLVVCMCACTEQSVFNGSMTGNDEQFLTDFSILNKTIDNKMQLKKGDGIEAFIDIKKGEADIAVENENGTVAYKGNNVESGEFTITITEDGNYTFYVTGRKAQGSVHFLKK